jgi:hypothetical protein
LEVGQARRLGAAQAGQRSGAVAGRARRNSAGGRRVRAHPCTHVVGDLPGSGRRRRAVVRYRPARVEAFQHGWPLASVGRGDGEPRHCWALYKGAGCCCRRLAWAGAGRPFPARPSPKAHLALANEQYAVLRPKPKVQDTLGRVIQEFEGAHDGSLLQSCSHCGDGGAKAGYKPDGVGRGGAGRRGGAEVSWAQVGGQRREDAGEVGQGRAGAWLAAALRLPSRCRWWGLWAEGALSTACLPLPFLLEPKQPATSH